MLSFRFSFILSAALYINQIYSKPLAQAILSSARTSTSHARIEITSSKDAVFPCASDGQGVAFTSGYAHLTNEHGEENAHAFWILFPSTNPSSPSSKSPTILSHGGGPGATALTHAFEGGGPCKLNPIDGDGTGQDEGGRFEKAPWSWTDLGVNMLFVDHPIGTGFSYASHPSGLSNNSRDAGYELDRVMQGLLKEFDYLGRNPFHVHSGSYGGTFVPHFVHAIHERNNLALTGRVSNRIQLEVESVILYNPWSDPLSQYTWLLPFACNDQPIFNTTSCAHLSTLVPNCTDSVRLAMELPESLDLKKRAGEACAELGASTLGDRNLYDAREEKCSMNSPDDVMKCFPDMGRLNATLNQPDIRSLLGIPSSVKFDTFQRVAVNEPYGERLDEMQEAYKMLRPVLEDGMRLLVYSGMQDSVCHWRGTESWMKLLRSPYQERFIRAEDKRLKRVGKGWVRKVGDGAGDYALLKIEEAGHQPIATQPELVQNMISHWLSNTSMI